MEKLPSLLPHLLSTSVVNTLKTVRNSHTKLNNNQVTDNTECENPFDILIEVGEENTTTTPHISCLTKPKEKNITHKNKNDKPQCKVKINKSKLLILADSHGRSLGHLIEQKTYINVCSFVRYAKFHNVVEDVKELCKHWEKMTISLSYVARII